VLADKIPVLMGDCNKWWCIHVGPNDKVIHLMGPNQLSSVPEGSAAEAERSTSANCVKAIISKARDDRKQGLVSGEGAAVVATVPNWNYLQSIFVGPAIAP
jgi:hypothetical protein